MRGEFYQFVCPDFQLIVEKFLLALLAQLDAHKQPFYLAHLKAVNICIH